MRDCTANPAHAEDSEHFSGGVVAEGEVGAAPLSSTHRGEGDGDAAEGAEEEEEGCVGCGGVDRDGG